MLLELLHSRISGLVTLMLKVTFKQLMKVLNKTDRCGICPRPNQGKIRHLALFSAVNIVQLRLDRLWCLSALPTLPLVSHECQGVQGRFSLAEMKWGRTTTHQCVASTSRNSEAVGRQESCTAPISFRVALLSTCRMDKLHKYQVLLVFHVYTIGKTFVCIMFCSGVYYGFKASLGYIDLWTAEQRILLCAVTKLWKSISFISSNKVPAVLSLL